MTHHINKLKQTNKKTYMIISRDTERAFDDVAHPFMATALNKIGKEGTYLNMIKAV